MAQVQYKQSNAKDSQNGQVSGKGQNVYLMDRTMECLHPIGQRQGKGDGLKEEEQLINGKEETTEEDMGKWEKLEKIWFSKTLLTATAMKSPQKGRGRAISKNASL